MIRVISIVVAVLILSYILFVSVFFKESQHTDVCHSLEVVVVDSLDKHFVTKSEIAYILREAKLYPVDKPIRKVNTDKIEKLLLKNNLLAKVEAYKTPSGIIKLEVEQKIPILRVMGIRGNYYVDNKGTVMPISRRCVANVPIVCGYVEKDLATTELYKFALFLQENKFWNDFIEQIYVLPTKEIELIPRIGNHRIILGSFSEFKEKLENLKLFYEQAIPKVGWEKYSIINLKYKNQIICTKR